MNEKKIQITHEKIDSNKNIGLDTQEDTEYYKLYLYYVSEILWFLVLATTRERLNLYLVSGSNVAVFVIIDLITILSSIHFKI